MGLFSFIKDAGKKILHLDNGSSQGTVSDAASKAGEALQQYIKNMGLNADEVKTRVEGEKVVLDGKAPSQDIMEKIILAAGNIAGISQVESNIQTAAATEQSHFYTVKSGDTLSKIAKEQYGEANRYPEIFEANRPMLKTADEIYPGQQLRIPQKQNKAA